MKVNDLKWLSVWCREFGKNFGDVEFRPKLGSLKDNQKGKGVAGEVFTQGDKTIFVDDFSFNPDGGSTGAPDTFFLVGTEGAPGDYSKENRGLTAILVPGGDNFK